MMNDSPHILVVDDERVLADLYRLDLESQGYRVSVVRSARAALEAMASWRPDVVVTDIRLPDMDGLELMGRILAVDPTIHVVLNTAYGAYKDSFLSWSADAYLIKSADTRPLLREVERLTGSVVRAA